MVDKKAEKPRTPPNGTAYVYKQQEHGQLYYRDADGHDHAVKLDDGGWLVDIETNKRLIKIIW